MDNSDKIILDLCGGTGSWSAPYKKAGYDVRLITLPYYNVLTYQPPKNVYGVLAAPPCTHFSIAANRLWKQKDKSGETQKALDIVFSCLKIINQCKPKFWALENTKGRLNRFIGEPVLRLNAAEFGAPYSKGILLWGDFNIFLVRSIPDSDIKCIDECRLDELYQLPTNYNLNIDHCKRAAMRSIYPPEFVQSFFLANQ